MKDALYLFFILFALLIFSNCEKSDLGDIPEETNTNNNGSTSDTINFTVEGIIVGEVYIKNETSSSVTINSEFTSLAPVTYPISNYGHIIVEDRVPTIEDYDKITDFGAISTPDSFCSTFNNLKSSTTYFYRVYTISNGVVGYDDVVYSFSTIDNQIPPVATTISSNYISSAKFRVEGQISRINDNQITRYGFLWINGTSTPTINNYDNIELLGTNVDLPEDYSFSRDINNLQFGSFYRVVAFAENEYGITYGDVLMMHGEYDWKNYNSINQIKSVSFEDDFSNNNNNWYEATSSETNSGTSYNVTSGSYKIITPDDFSANTGTDEFIAPSDNYQIDLDVRQASSPQYASGLRFEGDDNTNGYAFRVKSNGDEYYSFGYWDDNDNYNSLSYSTSFPLNSGYNKLTVRKVNGKFYFFINDDFIFEHNDILYTGSEFRLRASGGGITYFDNIKICRIGN